MTTLDVDANRTALPKTETIVPSEVVKAQDAVNEILAQSSLPRTRATSAYSALSKQVKAEGLLNRATGFYWRKFATITTLVLLSWVTVFMVGSTPGVLFLAPVLGILTAQYGFLAHEASHQQVFASPTANKRAGILLANGFAGLAYGWWMVKHSKHHANPNQVKKDPDIHISVLSFTPESLREKTGVEGWFARHQGIFFLPLLTLTAFDLLKDSLSSLFSKDSKIDNRKSEIALLLGRQVVFPAILFMTLSPWIAAGFWAINMMFFGFFMGAAFAPNHKGMPILPKDAKVDFLRRQVLTSRNIKGGHFMDNLMGGLNYQIEHHLFPSMPRPHLRRASEIVKGYCAENRIPYYEASLVGSYAVVIRYLNKVGLSAADPFDCPLAGQLRLGLQEAVVRD